MHRVHLSRKWIQVENGRCTFAYRDYTMVSMSHSLFRFGLNLTCYRYFGLVFWKLTQTGLH